MTKHKWTQKIVTKSARSIFESGRFLSIFKSVKWDKNLALLATTRISCWNLILQEVCVLVRPSKEERPREGVSDINPFWTNNNSSPWWSQKMDGLQRLYSCRLRLNMKHLLLSQKMWNHFWTQSQSTGVQPKGRRNTAACTHTTCTVSKL